MVKRFFIFFTGYRRCESQARTALHKPRESTLGLCVWKDTHTGQVRGMPSTSWHDHEVNVFPGNSTDSFFFHYMLLSHFLHILVSR